MKTARPNILNARRHLAIITMARGGVRWIVSDDFFDNNGGLYGECKRGREYDSAKA